jgi:cell division protein FtsL
MGFFSKYMSKAFNKEANRMTLLNWILSKRWFLFILLITSAIFLILLVNNVRRVNSIMVENRIIEADIYEIENINARLYSKIVELESAERIIPYAETHLQMEIPLNGPIIVNK